MHKIKPGTLTAGINKGNFKRNIERIVASGNAFSLMASVRGTPHTGNSSCMMYWLW